VNGYRVHVKRRIGPADMAELHDLLDAAAAADGRPPLSERKWLDLVDGGHTGHDASIGLLAHEDDDAVLVGYGQLTRGRDTWGLELVVHPDHRSTPGPLGAAPLEAALLEAAVEEVRHGGGGRVRYWAPMATPRHDVTAAALGFALDRDLHQLRIALPLPPGPDRDGAALPLRSFRPGLDERAWLDMNNLAFADHPEQGDWDMATLLERESQEWFDPNGLLLYEKDGQLAASCWTKVHGAGPDALGEIYVIAVNPAYQGHGLGRALTVAGLDHLASTGITTGMLYVDAGNEAALGLYCSLGFVLDHTDRAYIRDVPAAPSGPPRQPTS